jgi:hypothetical protein
VALETASYFGVKMIALFDFLLAVFGVVVVIVLTWSLFFYPRDSHD